MFEDPSLPKAAEAVIRTPAERKDRQLQFARVLNVTALLYAFLHKFFVPLVLYALDGKTRFCVMDWWWVYHAGLALVLKRKTWHDVFLRITLGFGFGGLLIQSYDGLIAQGWHSFSLWLTTATSGAVLIYVTSLTPAWSKRSIMQGLMGFFLGLSLMGTITLWLGMDRYALTAKPNKQGIWQAVPSLDKATACGTQKFSLPIKADKLVLPDDIKRSNRFFVKDCGFSVALQQVNPAQSVEVVNEGSTFLNIRLNHLVGQRWQPISNRPLRPSGTLQIGFNESATETLWILESDARPQAGLIVLFSDADRLQEKLKSLGISNSIVFSREGIMGGD